MGAGTKWAPRRIAEYCDEWFPVYGWGDLGAGFAAIRDECDRIGWPFEDIQHGVMALYDLSTPNAGVERIGQLIEMGFPRILLNLDPAERPNEQYEAPEKHKALIDQLG